MNQPNWLDDILSEAARDDQGRIYVKKVRTVNGAWNDVAVRQDGTMLTFWMPWEETLPKETARNAQGDALMTIFATSRGFAPVPIDENSIPLMSLEAVVDSENMVLPNQDPPNPSQT